ncbi:hypothetical protein [Clostridium brassicae]|uniref:Uncharacterized protein n=1 Tax=Clostridium brassicae TaxID=2999072 RepID=A0ABT4D573_9CLOT|nr:hypothetical protein [Clostridium brassicae]MCY6957430.1 hypothetical protein [Clostridium brassicae]
MVFNTIKDLCEEIEFDYDKPEFEKLSIKTLNEEITKLLMKD